MFDLEKYMIAEESKLGDFVKNLFPIKSHSSNKNNYLLQKKYYEYLDSLDLKANIPQTLITMELKLRTNEFKQIMSTIKSIYTSQDSDVKNAIQLPNNILKFNGDTSIDDINDFLNGTELILTKENSVTIMSFYDDDWSSANYDKSYLNSLDRDDYYELINDIVNKITKYWQTCENTLNKMHFKCYKNLNQDWDKYEGYFTLSYKASDEFLNKCKEYGYISYEEYLQNNNIT